VRATIAWLLIMALAGSPVAAQKPSGPGTFVAVEGGTLWTEECGSGGRATLVLVHDGVVHSAVWDDVWPAFCREFRVVRYDRRGYGRSPAATTWHSETDDLLAVLDAHHIDRAALVASSHGGELAIDFTLRAPERVSTLVLIGAVLSGFPYSEHFIERGMKASEPLRTNDVAGAIELGIPNAERVIVKETGHLMYLEKPAEFARLVTTFVRRHGGKSSP
jgi:pimeloyl-ACP methyl ester carboxylesterase